MKRFIIGYEIEWGTRTWINGSGWECSGSCLDSEEIILGGYAKGVKIMDLDMINEYIEMIAENSDVAFGEMFEPCGSHTVDEYREMINGNADTELYISKTPIYLEVDDDGYERIDDYGEEAEDIASVWVSDLARKALEVLRERGWIAEDDED